MRHGVSLTCGLLIRSAVACPPGGTTTPCPIFVIAPEPARKLALEAIYQRLEVPFAKRCARAQNVPVVCLDEIAVRSETLAVDVRARGALY